MSLVSVILPTYNRESVLPRAIESVLAQTYADFELIVVDDASTDHTETVIELFDDERIQYYRFEENRGANAARNKGIEIASGAYLSFLDSDDVLKPKHLESVVDIFESEESDCAGVFTAFEIEKDGERLNRSGAKDGYVTYDEILAGNVVGGFSCVTIRSAAFDHVGVLDESLRSHQDYDLFIRLLREGFKLKGINESLVVCHKGSDNRISDNPVRTEAGTERILEKHGDVLSRPGIARLYYYSAFGYAENGEYKNARDCFRRSIRADPTRGRAYPHLFAAIHPTTFAGLLTCKRELNKVRNALMTRINRIRK